MKIKTFINNQLSEYKEPSREGTPKGEAIGLSRQKYEAALWVGLTNLKGPPVTRIIGGLSPSLLRNWKTETAFKEAVSEAVQNFIRTIYRLVGDGPLAHTGERDLYSNYLKQEAEKAINNRLHITGHIVLDEIKNKLTSSKTDGLEDLSMVAKFFFGTNSVLYLRTREVFTAKLACQPKLTRAEVNYMTNCLTNIND